MAMCLAITCKISSCKRATRFDSLPAAQQYSYSFDGNTQTLDHIMLGRQGNVLLVNGRRETRLASAMAAL